MPLAALYGIAAGIVLALALIGRRLHAAMLQDALSGRQGAGRLLWTAGMVLLAAFLVLLGAVVAIVALLRTKAPAPPF